jgi:phage major head subunit gpT-like protein
MGASGLGSRSIIGQFYAALEAVTGASWVSKIAMLMDSDQESETYKWLGMVPAMREWIGGRNAKGFRENGITITNKTWEATLEILVDWIRRDKTGQIAVRIAELAVRASEHDAKLLSTLITNGTGATSGYCYDGQVFFDIDHSEGDSGTQLNLLAAAQVAALNVAAPTAPTSAEAVKAILGVIAYMLNYKDDQGEPMNANARNFLVMTSPALWGYLAQGIIQPVVTSGETNAIVALKADGFNVSIAANPRLAYTKQFVTFRTDAPAKPLIIQEEEPMSVSALAEGSEEEFKNNRHLYGIKRISNVGYGYWQYAAHATLE